MISVVRPMVSRGQGSISQDSWSISTFCGSYPRVPCSSAPALHILLPKSWHSFPTAYQAVLAETGAETPPTFQTLSAAWTK